MTDGIGFFIVIEPMTIGFIGLGNMGRNMVTRLLTQGVGVVGYNRTAAVTRSFAGNVVAALRLAYGGHKEGMKE